MKVKLVIENVDLETCWDDMIEKLVENNDEFWQLNTIKDHPEKAYIVIEPEPDRLMPAQPELVKQQFDLELLRELKKFVLDKFDEINYEISEIQKEYSNVVPPLPTIARIQLAKLTAVRNAYQSVKDRIDHLIEVKGGE